MTLGKYLKELADHGKPLRLAGVVQLSSLSTDEVTEFRATWASLERPRRHELLSKMVELCEENAEIDFTSVYFALLGDADEDVREKATRGLWECGDRVLIRPLIGLLKDDPSPRVRAAAGVSLGRFAEMAQEGKLLSRDGARIREALLHVIARKGEQQEVRRRAIEAVASFNSPEVQQIIREAYQSGDPKLKQSAIYAMGRSSDTQWLPIVVEETQHQHPAIRYEAANACGQLGDESIVPHLIRLIKDDDAHVQLSAVQALGAIGGPLAKRALLRCLRMGDDGLEEAAHVALSSIEFDEDPLSARSQA